MHGEFRQKISEETYAIMDNQRKAVKNLGRKEADSKIQTKKLAAKTYRIPPRTTPNGFSSAAKPMVAS